MFLVGGGWKVYQMFGQFVEGLRSELAVFFNAERVWGNLFWLGSKVTTAEFNEIKRLVTSHLRLGTNPHDKMALVLNLLCWQLVLGSDQFSVGLRNLNDLNEVVTAPNRLFYKGGPLRRVLVRWSKKVSHLLLVDLKYWNVTDSVLRLK